MFLHALTGTCTYIFIHATANMIVHLPCKALLNSPVTGQMKAVKMEPTGITKVYFSSETTYAILPNDATNPSPLVMEM